MDPPNQWNNKRCHKEHNCLLLNYTVRVGVEVVVSDGFNGDCHYGSSEKHAQSVFKSKRVVLFVRICMMFHMDEKVQNLSHHEFIE
jgi:hypothetical protein